MVPGEYGSGIEQKTALGRWSGQKLEKIVGKIRRSLTGAKKGIFAGIFSKFCYVVKGIDKGRFGG